MNDKGILLKGYDFLTYQSVKFPKPISSILRIWSTSTKNELVKRN